MIKTSNLPLDLLDVSRMAVRFYVDQYFTKAAIKRLESITLAFRKMSDGELGNAHYEENGRKLPCEFTIEFNNDNRDIPVRDHLHTLMHEMTHVKQYADGRLKLRHLHDLWEGQRFDPTKDYWSQPWEVEAQGIEVSAYQLFTEKHPELQLERFRPVYEGRAASNWLGKAPWISQ